MNTPAIETTGLTKTFTSGSSTMTAVDHLDLTIDQRDLVAFLGPNGAGKSTTLKMLTTLLRPSDGEIRLLGHDVVREPNQVRRLFGFVGQGNGAGHLQYGRDEVIGQAQAHGMTKKEAVRKADELIEQLELTEVARKQVQHLSGGQRRRFDIAIGLVASPKVLFLDEPSTGLDPQSRAHLQALIRTIHETTGSTIVLTTHYLDEADALSQRVIVIDHGKVIADDTAASLKADLGDLVTIHFDSDADTDAAVDALTRHHSATKDQRRVTIRTPHGPRHAITILDDLRDAGHAVAGIEVTRPSLDDVFLNLTGRSLRDSGDATTTEEPALTGAAA